MQTYAPEALGDMMTKEQIAWSSKMVDDADVILSISRSDQKCQINIVVV